MGASETSDPAILNFPIQRADVEEKSILLEYSPAHYAQQLKLDALSYLQDIQQGKYKLCRKGILYLRSVNDMLRSLGHPPVANYQFLGVNLSPDSDFSDVSNVVSLPKIDQDRFSFPVEDENRVDFLAAVEEGFLQREKIKNFLYKLKIDKLPIDNETIEMVKAANKVYEFYGLLPIEIDELLKPSNQQI